MTVEEVDAPRSPSPWTIRSPAPLPAQGRQLRRRLHRLQAGGRELGADGIKTHPVGTGPFMFESYTPAEQRGAGRQRRLLPGRAAAGRRRGPLHGGSEQPRAGPPQAVSSTSSTARRTRPGSTASRCRGNLTVGRLRRRRGRRLINFNVTSGAARRSAGAPGDRLGDQPRRAPAPCRARSPRTSTRRCRRSSCPAG